MILFLQNIQKEFLFCNLLVPYLVLNVLGYGKGRSRCGLPDFFFFNNFATKFFLTFWRDDDASQYFFGPNAFKIWLGYLSKISLQKITRLTFQSKNKREIRHPPSYTLLQGFRPQFFANYCVCSTLASLTTKHQRTFKWNTHFFGEIFLNT